MAVRPTAPVSRAAGAAGDGELRGGPGGDDEGSRGGPHVTSARRGTGAAPPLGGAARPSGRPVHLRQFPPPLGSGSGLPRRRSGLFVLSRPRFGTLRLPSAAPVTATLGPLRRRSGGPVRGAGRRRGRPRRFLLWPGRL